MSNLKLDFFESLMQAEDLNDRWEKLISGLHYQFGITGVFYGVHYSKNYACNNGVLSKIDCVTNYPEQFLNQDTDSLDSDRSAHHCAVSTSPILWQSPEMLFDLTPEEQKLQNVLKDLDMEVGVTIPIHKTQGYGGVGLVSMGANPNDFRKRWYEYGDDIQEIVALFDALYRNEFLESKYPINVEQGGILNRLIEGQPPKEIAINLGVTDKTVTNKINTLKLMLDARTTPQLTAKAKSLKLVD